ncbi:hypothetical protein DWW16_12580 [Bacteroides clarus]|uniref:Uncharacterized protein n=1 Tax=Bacteroides clarus TaxID=626929 RepID=A0A412Y6E2_9BACE|nr:hypothetical protein DWW16_12580 [Bacteroides clarus]RGV53030.1 hypothetical protein DWW09_10845 [Bacteroides clarus]
MLKQTILQTTYDKSSSLNPNSIRSLFVDGQKGVWVGTYYGGLSYYHPLAPAFSMLKRSNISNF